MHLRIVRIATLSLLAYAGNVPEQDPKMSSPPPSAQAPHVGETKPNPELAALLAGWEAASGKVETLIVVFERADRSRKWGDQFFEGKAIFQKPNLAVLEFRKAILDAEGKPKIKPNAASREVMEVEPQPFERWVWTGDQLLQYQWDERSIYVYPLPRPDVAPGLMAAFARSLADVPYWYQIEAARLQERYNVRLVQVEGKEPMIELTGRNTKDSPLFKRALIGLDRQTFLPNLVILYNEGDNDRQDLRFTATLTNQPVAKAYFHPPTSIRGWRTIGSLKLDDPGWQSLEQFGTALEGFFAAVETRLAGATIPPVPKVDPVKPADDPGP